MKKIFTTLSLVGIAVFATVPAMRAADSDASTPPSTRPHAGEMRDRRMKHLDEQLALTPEQKTQIYAIWDKAEKETGALRHDSTVSADDRKTKRRAILKATHDEVRGVLTPEQQTKFDAMPRERAGGPRHAEGDEKTN